MYVYTGNTTFMLTGSRSHVGGHIAARDDVALKLMFTFTFRQKCVIYSKQDGDIVLTRFRLLINCISCANENTRLGNNSDTNKN